MCLTRRRFLVQASAGAGAFALLNACGPAPEGELPPEEPSGPGPEPEEPWAPSGDVSDSVFASGLQVGDADTASALVSLQTSAAAVSLVLARGVEGGWEEERRLDVDISDGAAQTELDGLRPDTTYAVVAYDGDRRSTVSRFRTALPAGTSRKLRFGATSCLGGNAPWRTLSLAAEEKLDFFLFNGDTVYVDGYADSEVRGVWQGAMRTQGMKDVTASTSMIATWDDHEVDNNWSWAAAGIGDRVELGLAELRRHMPMREGGGDLGVWRKMSWGDVADVFVLDARGERVNGDYLSRAQLDWLKTGLSESTARFKLILNTVPITDLEDVVGDLGAEDRWQGYPAQRTELVEHIYNEEIAGVLFISGDFHIGAIGKIDKPGAAGQDIWEVLAGPGGSPINPAINFGVTFDEERFPVVFPGHNYALFEADPDSGEILVKLIEDQGLVVGEQLIKL
jgi:alkaline phosphatase D